MGQINKFDKILLSKIKLRNQYTLNKNWKDYKFFNLGIPETEEDEGKDLVFLDIQD